MSKQNNIGKNIRKHRRIAKLNQQSLADRAELSRTTISDIETGKTQPIGHNLMSIARALGISIQILFD